MTTRSTTQNLLKDFRQLQSYLFGLLPGYSTEPSSFLTGFEYRTLSKPFVSIFGLVIKKLTIKKPPNNSNKIIRGRLRPISEKDNKNKYILSN